MASLPAPPPEENSLRRHTSLCNELAVEPAHPDSSGVLLKLDSLSDRMAAESARTTARAAPGPGRHPSGRLTNFLHYDVSNAQRRPPGSDDKRAASDAAQPARRRPGRPKMTVDDRAAAKRKRDILAEEVSAREYQRRRHNLQVRFYRGRRAAVAAPPTSGAPTSDVASGAMELQRASAHMLSALTPARMSDLQSGIDAVTSVTTEADEDDFLNELFPPLAANSTLQPPQLDQLPPWNHSINKQDANNASSTLSSPEINNSRPPRPNQK
jgi:hypothetical protein